MGLWVFWTKVLKKFVEVVQEIIFFLGTHKTINFETNAEILQPRAKKLHFRFNRTEKI